MRELSVAYPVVRCKYTMLTYFTGEVIFMKCKSDLPTLKYWVDDYSLSYIEILLRSGNRNKSVCPSNVL